MKGQLSAEMLILIVVVLAVVALAATQLMGTAKETGKSIQEQTSRVRNITSEALKGQEGDRCIEDGDCMAGLSCDESYRCA
jgi:Sec-independent protein translocase protein TatA